MATPAQQQDPMNNEQQDPAENQQRDPGHNDQRNHSESEDENGPPPRNIPVLYVPDLANTILSEAILDGIRVGNSGRKYIIHTPRLKDVVGIERLKVTLPTGELETCSDPPMNFVTDCQPTPFNLPLLRGALKDMRKDNPDLQFIPGDDWPTTHTRYLRREELQERLGAYFEISVQYGKCILELDAAQLILDTDKRHRLEYGLELLIQWITNRLDEILSILARDNMLRKKGKKRVYPLPSVNPRAVTISSTGDARKMQEDIQKDMIEINNYALKPIPEGEEDRPTICYDGSDIPDDNTRGPRNVTGRTNQNTTSSTNSNTLARTSTGRAQDRTQHTVNFESREQHRTSALEDVQQRLTQMAQETNSANTENVRLVRQNDSSQNNRRWRNMAERHHRTNGQDNHSSSASESGTSTDWDGHWTGQECSACGMEGHNSRGCRARQNNELWCTRCNRNNHCNNTCRLPPRRSSTPRYTEDYHPHPSPHSTDNQTVPPVEPHYGNETTPAPVPNTTTNQDISVLIRTCLNENKEKARGLQQQKNLLANIPLFDRKDKKACLMWVNHVEHTARQAKMSFREAVNAKAGPTVVTVISRYPNASDAQLKRIILESFSNVGTRLKATQYLKKLRVNSNEALAAHNAEYEAVHTVAYGVAAEHQTDEVILLNYANTLCDYASTKLRRKILRRNSHIKTLKDAMEEAEELDSQSRQEEISKLERDSIREVTLSDSINNISLSEESVNFMQTRGGDNKFNSTMKNGHQNFSPNNKGNYSSHKQLQ